MLLQKKHARQAKREHKLMQKIILFHVKNCEMLSNAYLAKI